MYISRRSIRERTNKKNGTQFIWIYISNEIWDNGLIFGKLTIYDILLRF